MKNRKKGFTLVEVLIVVVIIAILASLIVPRMLMQTEKAKAAEALQMIGAIKRAAERYYDFNGTYDVPSVNIVSSPAGTSGDWADLGLTGIEKTKDWKYSYLRDVGNFVLRAQDYDSATGLVGKKYEAHYELMTGWECGPGFKYIDNDSSGASGCTI